MIQFESLLFNLLWWEVICLFQSLWPLAQHPETAWQINVKHLIDLKLMSPMWKSTTFSHTSSYFPSFPSVEFLRFVWLYQSLCWLPFLSPTEGPSSSSFSSWPSGGFLSHLVHVNFPSFSLPRAIICVPKAWLPHSLNKYSLNKYPWFHFFLLHPHRNHQIFLALQSKSIKKLTCFLLLPTRVKLPSSPGPLH